MPKLLTKIMLGQTINAIVLFGNIYFRDKKNEVDKNLYKHEMTHVEQQRNEGVLFYLRYFYEYIINLTKYKNHFKAYYNISYEKEARKAEK